MPPTRRSSSAAPSTTTSASSWTARPPSRTTPRAGRTAGRREPGTFTDTSGGGFIQHSGTFNFNQYYLAEWRNYDGFDIGLKYTYDTRFFNTATGEWNVTFTPYNAPGMLVWYRDIQYGSVNHVTTTTNNLPSTGSKGSLLVVDSHFDPVRRDASIVDGTTLKNMPSRAQSSNAAFNTWGTHPFTECFQPVATSNANACTTVPALAAVTGFDDRNSYYPGLELRTDGRLFFRDIDASVVLPSKENAPYTTRFVRHGRELRHVGTRSGVSTSSGPAPRSAPVARGDGADPASPSDLSFGVRFAVKNVGQGNKYATISVDPGAKK